MDTVAFIPVRGESKSIPLKNIKLLAGRPLVHWTIQAALDCKKIDRVYVASENPQIRAIAAKIADDRLAVIDRDPATATDTASTESALLEFAKTHSFKTIVLIQATSPLLSGADLNGALAKFETGNADSLLSVTREHRFYWQEQADGTVTPSNYDPMMRPRRQEWPGELVENGAFYITKKENLEKTCCRISGRIEAWEMSKETALELDEPHDWQIAEQFLLTKDNNQTLAERSRLITLLVTDVDGVLTDSGIYYSPDGEALKKFNTRDGMGIELWRKAGFSIAIMTKEATSFAKERAAKLKIEHVLTGVEDKGSALESFIKKQALTMSQVAFIGDDINDLSALEKAGLAACPADAAPPNQAVAHYRCNLRGGEGCVRELIDLILKYKE